MNIQEKTKALFVASSTTTLLALITAPTATAATTKTATTPLSLEQSLNCLDWAKKELSFTSQLAIAGGENMAKQGMAKPYQQFKQQYNKQKTIVVDDPDDDNFCQDCPETAVYLAKDKNNPIQRIETLVHVSVVGASTSVYRTGDLLKTKETIEDGLKIKFSRYTGQQFKSFKQQWDQASDQDKDKGKRIKTTQVFQQYPHLNVFNGQVFQNQNIYTPNQIYIYSQPYKRDASDLTGMIAFISVYDNPVKPSQHILQCGFIDSMTI